LYRQHCSYPSELFNHRPQSLGLGHASQSAYIFVGNVAHAKASQPGLLQAHDFSHGWLTS